MNTIETDRLIIAELTLADAPFILALTNSAGWLQFIGDRGIKDITGAENYITNGPMASYAKFDHGLCRVSLKSSGEPIGMCGIIKRDTLENKDIGFAFLPQYTGNGYALEAATAVLAATKKQFERERIAAITIPSNERSINLLTKLGLVFEKIIVFPGKDEELMLFLTQA
jgi:ribosomal-protein-alanine N-acetyltransferase